jgi:hypothetical protein
MTPQTKSAAEIEIAAKVWGIVNALPHRGAILESDARAWVDEVVGLHGQAAIWHAIRLNGVGGSEIGVLVRNRAGVRADHQASAHDIVAGKLMRKAPTETSGHMTRGHENEEPHSRRFYAKYGASRDLEAYNALTAAKGRRAWMRYSPDDVVQMPVMLLRDTEGVFYPSLRGEHNKRWLIDYKAPSKIDSSDEIAFQYACQLTQGAILCAEAGIELHGMMLSQFDWANWALKDDVVVWDQSLGELVLDAGDYYWDYVLKGQVPDYIRTEEMVGMEEYSQEYLKAADMFANLVALADASKKRAEEIRVTLLEPVKNKRLMGQKITFGLTGSPILTMGSKQMLDREAVQKAFTPEQLAACSGTVTYDEKLMLAHLRSINANLEPFKKYDLDATKVYAMAAKEGLDGEVLVAEQLTLAASKAVKESMATFINENYPLSAAIPTREAEIQVIQADLLGSGEVESDNSAEQLEQAPMG